MLNIIKKQYKTLISDTGFSEILKGSIWALGARASSACLLLITTIIVARFYGANILGSLAVINSFFLFASLVTVLGMDISVLRLIPEHMVKYSPASAFAVYRKSQFLIITISIITGAVVFVNAGFIAETIFSKPHMASYFTLAAIFLVFKSLTQFNIQAARGLKLIRMFALMFTMPYLFNLILLITLGFIVHRPDVPIYAMFGGFALTGIMGWAVMERAFKKRITSKDIVRGISTRDILSLSLPMVMTAAMTVVIAQTGVIILAMFRPEQEVGFYSVAVNLATLTTFILSAINSMAAPKFSELFHTGKIDELFRVAKKSTRLIFWTTTPILLFLIILGKPLITLLFGPAFVAAYIPMVLLVTGQFVNSISGSTAIFMNMTGNEKAFRNIMASAAGINIILNIILIPHFNILGAAMAGMISLIYWNGCALLFMKLKYGRTICYVPILSR